MRLWLPAGYRMEPVLSDPLIEDPAQIAFDGNGRMFVVELRGYLQTPEGIDLIPPIGRISMHEDRDGDGVYQRHSVFVDQLVFPRFVMPFGANAILSMETNADEVWKYTDTNGDGVADKKELFATGFGRAGNMESQQASLFWAMDNWLYSTVNAFRLRWTPNGLVREPTGPNSSQWGVTQDNDGKVWFQGGVGLPRPPGIPVIPVCADQRRPAEQLSRRRHCRPASTTRTSRGSGCQNERTAKTPAPFAHGKRSEATPTVGGANPQTVLPRRTRRRASSKRRPPARKSADTHVWSDVGELRSASASHAVGAGFSTRTIDEQYPIKAGSRGLPAVRPIGPFPILFGRPKCTDQLAGRTRQRSPSISRCTRCRTT